MFISKKQNVDHALALKERCILWRRYFVYLVITPRSHSPCGRYEMEMYST